MTKFKRSSDLFRELIKSADQIKSAHRYPETGIVKIVLAGHIDIDEQQLTKVLKKSGYIRYRNSNSIAPEYIDSLEDFLNDIHGEDDVPEPICTTLLLKDIEPPPLENSDTGELKRDPVDAEFVAAACHSVRNGCNDDKGGDDLAYE